MKKFLIFLIVVGLGVGGYFGYKYISNNMKYGEIKKGWYIEIKLDEIKIREDASTKSEVLGKAKKGELYKVLDVVTDQKIYYWYKVDYKGKEAFIASEKNVAFNDENEQDEKKRPWVKDVNNPNDIKSPEIFYNDKVYHVESIDKIDYKHLRIVDDNDKHKITHIIYHEVNPYSNVDQYWILYNVEDDAGNKSSKLQNISFDINPDESQVIDFKEYNNPNSENDN